MKNRNTKKRMQRRRRAETRRLKWTMRLLEEQVRAVHVSMLFEQTPYEIAEQRFLACDCGPGEDQDGRIEEREMCDDCLLFLCAFEPPAIAARVELFTPAPEFLTYAEAVAMGDA